MGIVRRIDDLGRLVIPKEMRQQLNIQYGDAVDINLDGTKITVKKVGTWKDINGHMEAIKDILVENDEDGNTQEAYHHLNIASDLIKELYKE